MTKTSFDQAQALSWAQDTESPTETEEREAAQAGALPADPDFLRDSAFPEIEAEITEYNREVERWLYMQ